MLAALEKHITTDHYKFQAVTCYQGNTNVQNELLIHEKGLKVVLNNRYLLSQFAIIIL